MAEQPLSDADAAALGPDELTGLHLHAAKTQAAGLPAVVSSLKHVFGQAGIVRGTRALTLLNQQGGIDCPSCAWPDPDTERSSFEFCENGAKAIAWEADARRLTPEFFRQWDIDALGQQSDYWLGQQGRLTEPMILRPGTRHYEPISWEGAFSTIAAALNGLNTPDEAVFYTSGRTSNEAAFLYQLFIRQFGTNNLPDCSNMCHESSGMALIPTVGIGKGTVTLEDFQHAEVILILGQNPGTNHPRMLSVLQEARRAGARIVAINPLKEAGLLAFANPQEVRGMLGLGTSLAEDYLQVRIGGDQALLQGIMKVLVERGWIDQAFLAEKTEGYEALCDALAALDWALVEEQSGIARGRIESLAELLGKSQRIIACWAMGLTQHRHAVATIQDLVNLILLRGSIGKRGAGLCPVRGHSNVQGDRTMGIIERPSDIFLDTLGKVFDFEPPRRHGYDTVAAIRAMHEGHAKVFLAMGGNFLSATPDTLYTAEALRRCQLTAHVSIKLNRSHVVTGQTALILPCLGRTERDVQNGQEQFVTTENSMGVVQMSRGRLEPCSPHLLSEPAIVAGLARATLGENSSVPWEELVQDYDRIRDAIERVIPGFADYNVRVRHPGGFYLPNPPRTGDFPTTTGKARFTVHPVPKLAVPTGHLIMMTIRSHDQFNTTIYGLHDRYRGIANERRVILMHEDDIRERSLIAGDLVDLTSHYEGQTRLAHRFVVVRYDLPRGCCATYFPETNVLVPIDSKAESSHTPTSKYVIITVAKSNQEDRKAASASQK